MEIWWKKRTVKKIQINHSVYLFFEFFVLFSNCSVFLYKFPGKVAAHSWSDTAINPSHSQYSEVRARRCIITQSAFEFFHKHFLIALKCVFRSPGGSNKRCYVVFVSFCPVVFALLLHLFVPPRADSLSGNVKRILCPHILFSSLNYHW